MNRQEIFLLWIAIFITVHTTTLEADTILGLTTFKLVSKHSQWNDPQLDIPEIEVTFSNGHSDRLNLKHYNALPNSASIDHSRLCNYLGNLQNEKDATVAVTGCPDVERNTEKKMLITLMSSQSPGQKSFAINLNHDEKRMTSRSSKLVKRQLSEAQQVAEELETIISANEILEDDEIKDEELEARVSKAPETGVPCSIKARIKMGTDASANDYIQNRLKMSVDLWLAEMFTHVQSHYYNPTLQHRINFEVVEKILLYDEVLAVNVDNLNKLSKISAELNETDVALYAWVVDGGGANGLAYKGSACFAGTGERSKTSLTRGPSRYDAIIETAETLAHEIGHILGMDHAFFTSKYMCKSSKDGSRKVCKRCTNWNGKMLTTETGEEGECCTGFMDYGNHPEYWSTCSVRGFRHHYVALNWHECMPKDEEDEVNCGLNSDTMCFNVKLTTKQWANDISWSVGNCKSSGKGYPYQCTRNGGYPNNQKFVEHCCLQQGVYNVSCFDCSGDSWGEGAYLEINGKRYCDSFTGNSHHTIINVTSQCEWGPWKEGHCSKTCDTGLRMNTRNKTVIEKEGEFCLGKSTKPEKCNFKRCPVDCVWGDWKPGKCSKTCAGGKRTKVRAPKVKASLASMETFEGKDCQGNSTILEECNTFHCPVHCRWGRWKIGRCSKTCGKGGRRTISRTNVTAAEYGGRPCRGPAELEESCNEWRDCPESCDDGVMNQDEVQIDCGGKCPACPDDPCHPNPCQNDGICQDGAKMKKKYTCICEPGFMGYNCEIDDPCHPNPCQNDGICQDGVKMKKKYTCICEPRFSGYNCEIDESLCQPNPCQNGGTCTARRSGYTCNCQSGFLGYNCETEEICEDKIKTRICDLYIRMYGVDKISQLPRACTWAWFVGRKSRYRCIKSCGLCEPKP